MKKIILFIVGINLLLLSCMSNENGSNSTAYTQENNISSSTRSSKKFAPIERTSSLSEEEREKKILELRESLNEVNIETLLSSHSTRMSILPPAINEDITEALCKKVVAKMIAVASQNGISGVNGSSPIALALALNIAERSLTGTAPQKAVVKIDAVYYVLNVHSGDVYSSCSTRLTGVGSTFEEAANFAVEQMKNTPDLQKMLETADERIIGWYNSNSTVIVNKVNSALSEQNYAMAMAIINSVPESANKCYSQIEALQADVYDKMKKHVAAQELAAMKDAIAAAKSDYNPEVAAHLAMLPIGTPEAKEGNVLYDKYMKQIDDARMAAIAAEERARQEELELRKLQMKYEMEASMQEAQLVAESMREEQSKASSSENKGFFSGLVDAGKSFLSNAGAFSLVQSVLSSCLFII